MRVGVLYEIKYRSNFSKICPRPDKHVLVLLNSFDDHIILRLRTLTNRDHVAFRLTNELSARTYQLATLRTSRLSCGLLKLRSKPMSL